MCSPPARRRPSTIYIDPPFNTGKAQRARACSAVPRRADDGDRTGFGGRRYRRPLARRALLRRRLRRLPRLPRAAHRAARRAARRRTARSSSTSTTARSTTSRSRSTSSSAATRFMNEIIWAYDYGGRPERPLARQARHHPLVRRSTPATTPSTTTRSTASRTWRRARRPGEGRARQDARPTSGGTRSCPPTAARRPATRRRSRSASLRRIVRRHSRPGDSCSTSSPAPARPARSAAQLGRRFVLVDQPRGDRGRPPTR